MKSSYDNVLCKIWATLIVVFGFLAFVSSAAASLAYTFGAESDVAVTASNYVASGDLNLTLGFAPTPGTNLTVINNAGPAFITGAFNNVIQGGTVPLTYGGVTYNYIANYYGGNGRSLVLQWPCVGLCSWGPNDNGQLGNSGTTNSLLPAALTTSGALVGKTVIGLAAGGDHSLALTSDGQVFAWGYNYYGQLGRSGTITAYEPIAVSGNGVLSGKRVVAIAAGSDHSLALTSDGQVYAWGYNFFGQLGNNSTKDSAVPVAVTTSGVLSGKTVVAIAAGDSHSLALTSEGKVYAWGARLGRSTWEWQYDE